MRGSLVDIGHRDGDGAVGVEREVVGADARTSIVQRTSAETRAVARPIPMHPESRMAVKLAKAGWSRVKRASQVSERQRGEGAQVAKAHGVSKGLYQSGAVQRFRTTTPSDLPRPPKRNVESG